MSREAPEIQGVPILSICMFIYTSHVIPFGIIQEISHAETYLYHLLCYFIHVRSVHITPVQVRQRPKPAQSFLGILNAWWSEVLHNFGTE